MGNDVILQCAIDTIDKETALQLGDLANKGGADWLEVGTPLIKAEGVGIVRSFKEAFPNVPIVADLKTLDFGGIEAGLAIEAGADVVTISALAGNATIRSAANVADGQAVLIASLMGVTLPAKSAKRLKDQGVDRVLAHYSAEEHYSASRVDAYKAVASSSRLPVGIGGGLTLENIKSFADVGCSYFVVGRAITEAPDPRATTKRFKELLS